MPPAARTLALFSSGVAFPSRKCRLGQMAVPMVSEPAGDLLARSVPAGHVMDDDHLRIRPRSERARQVGIDLIAPMPAHVHRLRKQPFAGHVSLPPGERYCASRGGPVKRIARAGEQWY